METTPLFCDINGLPIAYHQDGTGETILLVHGITTYSFIWRRIVPLLRNHFRVISVDLLGCGESAKPLDVPYSLPYHCEILNQFIDCLGIAPVHFVGHDIGGGIAQVFAVRHPEKLIDLTLINSVGHNFWPVQPIVAMRTPIICQLAMATLDIGAFRLVVRRGLYHKEALTEELLQLFWKPMRDRIGRRAFLHFAKCLNNRDLVEIEKELQQITVPVHIIRGEADIYLSEAISEKLHRDIAGSTFTRIAQGGHFIQEDEPELLSSAITHFGKG